MREVNLHNWKSGKTRTCYFNQQLYGERMGRLVSLRLCWEAAISPADGRLGDISTALQIMEQGDLEGSSLPASIQGLSPVSVVYRVYFVPSSSSKRFTKNTDIHEVKLRSHTAVVLDAPELQFQNTPQNGEFSPRPQPRTPLAPRQRRQAGTACMRGEQMKTVLGVRKSFGQQ